MAEAFSAETDFTVWSDLSVNLGTLAVLLQTTDFYESFEAFIRRLFSHVMGTVGWDPKPGEGTYASPLMGSVGWDPKPGEGMYDGANPLMGTEQRGVGPQAWRGYV